MIADTTEPEHVQLNLAENADKQNKHDDFESNARKLNRDSHEDTKSNSDETTERKSTSEIPTTETWSGTPSENDDIFQINANTTGSTISTSSENSVAEVENKILLHVESTRSVAHSHVSHNNKRLSYADDIGKALTKVVYSSSLHYSPETPSMRQEQTVTAQNQPPGCCCSVS